MVLRKFKTIIIDDEEKARKNLRLVLEKYFPELGTDLVLYGKTKLFMRTPALNIIETRFNEKVKI